jgi:hypothetical protein
MSQRSVKSVVTAAGLARWALVAAIPAASLGAAQSALAATCPSTTFCLSDTVTTNSSAVVTVTNSGYSDNGSPTPIGSLTSFSLGDAFGAGQSAFGSDFTTSQTGGQHAPGATGSDSGWNFYDDYRFTINPGSSIDTAIISVNGPTSGTEVGGLEVRLFQAGPNGTSPNAPATLGAPAGGTLVDSWSTPFPGGSFVYTMPTGFSAGSYELQVRGLASNASSYGGNIEFTPVPLPAAAWFMVSALGALGAFRRRSA